MSDTDEEFNKVQGMIEKAEKRMAAREALAAPPSLLTVNTGSVGDWAIPFKNTVAPTFTFTLDGNVEALKITPDGFWVRGKKVEQDDPYEAALVYLAFKAFLAGVVR